MISTSLLVQSPLGVNDFFQNCCGRAEFIITLQPGEANHTITKIEWFEDGATDCGSTPISYNGNAWANPLPINFTLTQFNQLSIIVEICECNATPIQGELKLHVQGGATHSFFYDFNPIVCDLDYLPNDLNWYPCNNDCNQRQPVSINLENPTGLSYAFIINSDCNLLPGANPTEFYINGIAQIPNPKYIPPMQTSVLEWTICPEFDVEFTCSITIEYCECSKVINVNVIPVNCNDCGVNCYSSELLTENNYIPATFDFCDNGIGQVYQYGAIGEKKILKLSYQYDLGFFANGTMIYFNPVMFDVVCNYASKYGSGIVDSPPPAGWSYVFQIGDVGTSGIPMQLFGAGVNANSQKNISATIDIINNYQFVINLEFYLIADIENWISSNVLANQYKLFRNHISAPTELVNSVQSVYNINKSLCTLIYISDPNNLVQIPGSNPIQYENYECHSIKSMQITARFYNQGLYAGQSEMINPLFSFFRNSLPVNNFSSVLKTQIKFQVNYTGNITNILFWVIDASQFDNTIDFVANYDSSRAEITTNALISVLNNNLFSPSVAPTLIAPNLWECSAFFGINLNPLGQYYVIAVCYDSGTYIVNSFISEPLSVTQIPGTEICCPLNIKSVWSDYFNSYNGSCFAPTMKERINNSLLVKIGDFENCLKDYGWSPMSIDWTTFVTDIKLNVYRKELNFPNVGQSTYFMFNQYQSLRIPGYPANFNNLSNDFICQEIGLDFNVDWIGRVRYEQTSLPGSQVFVSNDATPLNRISAGGLGATYVSTLGINYDWADVDIYFEYIFRLDLSSLFPQPFILNLVYINKIHPIDFETTPNPFASLFKPLQIAGVKGTNPPVTITGQFCQGQFDYLIVTMQDNVTPDLIGKFIAFLDPYPYGISNLQEDDPVVSPVGFTQLDSTPIYNTSPTFNGSAQFYVDLSTLPVGKYQLCGLYLID